MKIIKTILDTKNNLVGFWMEGKETEFGGFLNETVQKAIHKNEIIAKKFRNNQIAVIDNKIVEQGKFRLNEVPMSRFDGINFYDIDNGITLVSRIVHDGKLIGFRVRTDGYEGKYKYDDVLRLAKWFRPTNFVLRTIKAKVYIAGKPGVMKLEDLPEEILGQNVQTPKRRRVGTGGQSKDIMQYTQIQNEKDLLTLYSIIRKYDGLVVRLPDEQYKAATKMDRKVASGFNELKYGEIAFPYISFGEKKLNANTTFRKPGVINLWNNNGEMMTVHCFVHSTKSIFLNGENYMKRFAVGLLPEGVEEFRREFETALVIKPVANKDLCEAINNLTGHSSRYGGTELVYFEVDTSKLSIIPPAKAKDYILSNKEIKETVYQMMHAKAHNKYLKAVKNDIIDKAGADGINIIDTEVYRLYKKYSPEELKILHEAGIDIFTGEYKKTEDIQGQAESSDIKVKDEEDTSISIEYALRGATTAIKKITVDMVENKEAHPYINEYLLMIADELSKITDLKSKYKAVNNYMKEMNKVLNECKKKLWLHKLGMYYTQDGRIHQHNKDMWVQNVKTRSKGARFDCVEPGCEDLQVTITGTTI